MRNTLCTSICVCTLQHFSEFSLTPSCVKFDCEQAFCNVWAGNYGTIARTHKTEHIYAWGLNASGQLGLNTAVRLNKYRPTTILDLELEAVAELNKIHVQTNTESVQCMPLYNYTSLVSHGSYVSSLSRVL